MNRATLTFNESKTKNAVKLQLQFLHKIATTNRSISVAKL